MLFGDGSRIPPPHGTDLLFLYAPGLLTLSAIILLCAYLVHRKLTSAQIFCAISAPGLILTVIYFLDLRYDIGFGIFMSAVMFGFIFLPGIWIFPLVTAVASRLIYLQTKARHPASGASALTIVISAALIALYFATAYMAEVIREL